MKTLQTKLGWVCLIAAASVLLLNMGCGKKSAEQTQAEFQMLRLKVIAGDFDQAIPKMKLFVQQNPDSKNASRAGLFLFKAHFAKNELPEAQKWCEWTIKNHPKSLEAHKCRYKLALISLAEGNTEKAKSILETVSQDNSNPLSPESLRLTKFLEEYSIKKK